MRNPKATTKRQRVQALVDTTLYSRITTLADSENRSESSMCSILLEEALDARPETTEQRKAANG